MLREIQAKGDGVKPYSRAKMAAMLDISVETFDRWMNTDSFTRQANTLRRITEVIEEYNKAS